MKELTKKQILKKEKRQLKRILKSRLEFFKYIVIKRDNDTCQMCNKKLIENKSKHVHHILPNTKKYFQLRDNPMNGVLLCPYCHRFSPMSPHQNSLYFGYWLKRHNRPQYDFLVSQLEND
jgi:hypothetical protein